MQTQKDPRGKVASWTGKEMCIGRTQGSGWKTMRNEFRQVERLRGMQCFPGGETQFVGNNSSRFPFRSQSQTNKQGSRRYRTPPTVRCFPSVGQFEYTVTNPRCVAYSWPLCTNMTPSTKPEVHNVSQRRQSRTEPRT